MSNYSQDLYTEMFIEAAARGRIIGKKGAKIRSVSKASGAKILFGGNLLQLSGSLDQRKIAVDLISKALD